MITIAIIALCIYAADRAYQAFWLDRWLSIHKDRFVTWATKEELEVRLLMDTLERSREAARRLPDGLRTLGELDALHALESLRYRREGAERQRERAARLPKDAP